MPIPLEFEASVDTSKATRSIQQLEADAKNAGRSAVTAENQRAAAVAFEETKADAMRIVRQRERVREVRDDERAARREIARAQHQAVLQRQVLATGAAQVASAAGIPIPGGATMLSQGLRGAGGMVAGVAVAVAATAAIREAVMSTSEWISRMEQLAQRSGETTEAVSTFATAIDRLGGDSRVLGPALDALAKNMENNAVQFEQLGIKSKGLAGLREVLGVLGNAAPGAERDRLGVELLGESYTQLGGVLNKTKPELDAFITTLGGSAKVVTDEAVKANREYLASLREIGNEMEEIKQRVGSGVAGAIAGVSGFLRQQFDELGTFVRGASPQQAREQAGAREAARRAAARAGSGPTGTGSVTANLQANLDPAVLAFRQLDEAGQKAFSTISRGATEAGGTINRTALKAVDGLSARFVALSHAGLLTGAQSQLLAGAQLLGLSGDQIRQTFDAAADIVGQEGDQLAATMRQRQVGAFDKLLFDTIVGSAKAQLAALDDQIAAIDERLSEIAERRKDADTFDPGQQSAELRAREEERIFTPKRPGEDDEAKQITRLQRDRALLQAKRDLAAADVEVKLANYNHAQAQLKAAEASRLAAIAEQVAAVESRKKWTEARVAVQEYRQALLDTGLGTVSAGPNPGEDARDRRAETTMRLLVDVRSGDGSITTLTVDTIEQVLNDKLVKMLGGAIVRVQRARRGDGSGNDMVAP